MENSGRTKVIPRRTAESAAMLASIKRAMEITAKLNRLTFNDADEIRGLFSELIGKEVDDSFLLIPPFYTTGGGDISVGRNVFVNQNCTFYDLGGLDIADDVMVGPNVSIITSGHPIEPSRRRDFVIAKPIVIERNVWIAANRRTSGSGLELIPNLRRYPWVARPIRIEFIGALYHMSSRQNRRQPIHEQTSAESVFSRCETLGETPGVFN